MASIKNFGLAGVSADVQLGKSGGRVRYGTFDTLSRYRFRNADDSAFLNVQIADPIVNDDATTKRYVDNAISAISGAGSLADVEADVANIIAATGLDAEGNFVTFTGSNYLTGATTIAGAITLLDSEVANNAGDITTLNTDLSNYKANISATAGTIIDGEGNFVNTAFANTAMDGVTTLEGALLALDTAIDGKDALSELIDTTIANVAANQILTYSATGGDAGTGGWINSDDLFLNGELVVTGNVSASANLVLNADVTGAATDDAIIEVNRGTDADVAIRWNESLDQWEYTNDGTNYYPFADIASILGEFSVVDAGGDGSLAYNSTTGVFTYTGPSHAEVIAHFTNGTGVFFNDAANVTTISIGQDVSTTADVTFNNVTVDGTLFSNDITAATVTVTGNLVVSGTTTTVNTETINLADNIITLNSNETGTPSQNAGIEVERGTATNVALRWNETSDVWEFTNDGTNYFAVGSTSDVDVHVVRASLTNAGGAVGTLESVSGKSYVASKIVVNVTTAFDGTGLVVSGATTGALNVVGDIDETAVGVYVIELDSGLTAGEAISLATGGATVGAATVTVEYYAV